MDTVAVILAAKAGDKSARQTVVNELNQRISSQAFHYAQLTGMDRDDLTQEGWLGVFQGLTVVNTAIGNPFAYLFMRGKWQMGEAIHRSARARHYWLDETIADQDKDPTDACLAMWQRTATRLKLSPIQVDIFDWLLAGYSQQSMADILGCTPANVSYHVKRIRQVYRQLTEETYTK